jgi:hypothetical protein
MKNYLTTLVFTFFISLSFSQELAVQGIARDVNGVVRESKAHDLGL